MNFTAFIFSPQSLLKTPIAHANLHDILLFAPLYPKHIQKTPDLTSQLNFSPQADICIMGRVSELRIIE